MALDRQSIERKDFPIGRRGYDPDAVDSHLASVAEEVDQLRASSRRRSETLASSASEQVRAIVEAAENSASEIQRQAEEEAQEIRAEAAEEAQSTRQHASAQAREYVGRVSESTAGMLQRLNAMESELSALVESLRTGANRLNADLQLLESGMQDVQEAAGPAGHYERQRRSASIEPPRGAGERPAARRAPQPSSQAEPALDEALADSGFEEDEEQEQSYESQQQGLEELTETVGDGDGDRSGQPAGGEGNAEDAEAARLIALNMALNGTTREETERYLSENFSLSDPDQLLDEVYASVEG